MHATAHSGGHSPKPINSPTSTSQLNPGSDNVQSATSLPSQAKGKKRERADQGYESIKGECFSKTADGDSGKFKPESIWKSEISKMTENGGLVDSEGVEKLVQLMQPVRAQKEMELNSRSMLAGVIAATEKFDCLSHFVQLGGLPVLDEWLQDVHKGRIGDGSPKDGNKSLEEFLLVLLRALGKLPVNLYALHICKIGRSVNHLRRHKNLKIKKKASSLVGTWKKRVEAEMSVIIAKSGSMKAVSKIDNGDSGQFKPEGILKSEISKMTENGGLVDSEGVEKLVQLMQPDRAEKMELNSRSMLAGVIVATEKFDCLGRFVQLRGLPVLDEWLQDVHKGRIGDGSPKDDDKSLEEFLLVLLRALDKLPVNLDALHV